MEGRSKLQTTKRLTADIEGERSDTGNVQKGSNAEVIPLGHLIRTVEPDNHRDRMSEHSTVSFYDVRTSHA